MRYGEVLSTGLYGSPVASGRRPPLNASSR
jgi:hypothetical protein